jgi:uncharacterized protein (DUF2252 family)
MAKPDSRERMLTRTRNLKMARSAHGYVRGSTIKFYEWLENSSHGKLDLTWLTALNIQLLHGQKSGLRSKR